MLNNAVNYPFNLLVAEKAIATISTSLILYSDAPFNLLVAEKAIATRHISKRPPQLMHFQSARC